MSSWRLGLTGLVLLVLSVPATGAEEGAILRGGRCIAADLVATATLDLRGTLDVLETLSLEVEGSPTHIVRTLRSSRPSADGEPHAQRVTLGVVKVGGIAVTPEVERLGERVHVTIPLPSGPRSGRLVAELRYEVTEATTAEGGARVMRWLVTGAPMATQLRSIEGTLRLPGSVGIRGVDVYTVAGFEGERREGAEARQVGWEVRLRSVRPFEPFERLELVVRAPGDVIREELLTARVMGQLRAAPLLLLPPALLLLALVIFISTGLDRRPGPVVPSLEPPPLRPAEAGLLADDFVDDRDLIATLIDLARRGHIGFVRQGPTFEMTLRETTDPKRPFESAILEGLARAGARPGETRLKVGTPVVLEHLRGALPDAIAETRGLVEAALVEQGMYGLAPSKKRALGRALFYGIAAITVGAALWIDPAVRVPYVVIAGLSLAGAHPCLRELPKRTRRGDRAFHQILSLMAACEDPPAQPDAAHADVEAILPYAVAFGLEDRWLRAHQGLFETPVPWLVTDAVSGLLVEIPALRRQLASTVLQPRNET